MVGSADVFLWERLHLKVLDGEFLGGPVVKTPRFHCRGRGFDPWSGN